MSSSFKELIWNHIIETDNYSIILLRFIRNIASYEKDKDRIVLLDKLNNMYFKIDDNKDYKDAYYNAIDAVMLNDPNVCKSIREKCYSLITKQENLEFALNLLQFSCKNIEPDEVKNALKNVFDQTLFASSDKEARPILTGLNVKCSNNTLEFVATDTYRLSKKIVEINHPLEFNVTIPKSSLDELNKISKLYREEVHSYSKMLWAQVPVPYGKSIAVQEKLAELRKEKRNGRKKRN